jgi:hypothetical protein
MIVRVLPKEYRGNRQTAATELRALHWVFFYGNLGYVNFENALLPNTAGSLIQ